MTHFSTQLALRSICGATLVVAGLVLVTSTAEAAPQPLIKYFQPMPIVGKLSTTVWGASTVGARDPANGLEDNGSNGGVGPRTSSEGADRRSAAPLPKSLDAQIVGAAQGSTWETRF